MTTSTATLFAVGVALIFAVIALVMLTFLGIHYSHFILTVVLGGFGILMGALHAATEPPPSDTVFCVSNDDPLGEAMAGGFWMGLGVPFFAMCIFPQLTQGIATFSLTLIWLYVFYVLTAMLSPWIGYVLLGSAQRVSARLRT